MREVTDAAAVAHAAGIVAEMGDIALEKTRRDRAPRFTNAKPAYYRGARIRPK